MLSSGYGNVYNHKYYIKAWPKKTAKDLLEELVVQEWGSVGIKR